MQLDWQQKVNKELGKCYRWERFARGSSNTLFRGYDDNECIVLRQNGVSSDTPGVDRGREETILKIITPFTWAPKVIMNRPELAWCAMSSYSKLPTHSTDQNLSLAQETQLIQAINELQSIPVNMAEVNTNKPLLRINYDKLWDETYLPLAQTRADTQAKHWIRDIKKRLNKLPPVPSCFVHHDLHIGNLTYDKHLNQLILLDWEYSGIANPWFDAAALKRFFNIGTSHIAQLPAFTHLNEATFNTGLSQALALSKQLDKLWYWARAEQPNQED